MAEMGQQSCLGRLVGTAEIHSYLPESLQRRKLLPCATCGPEHLHQSPRARMYLLDYLVGANEQDRWNFEIERPGGAQIDY
jgi:hypothetical protein